MDCEGTWPGELVRRWREYQGLSRATLALRAGIGKDTLRRLEEGGANCRLTSVEKVAAGLGIRLSTLMEPSACPSADQPRSPE